MDSIASPQVPLTLRIASVLCWFIGLALSVAVTVFALSSSSGKVELRIYMFIAGLGLGIGLCYGGWGLLKRRRQAGLITILAVLVITGFQLLATEGQVRPYSLMYALMIVLVLLSWKHLH